MTSTIPIRHTAVGRTAGLVVIALSGQEWRVSDPSRRADDAQCLVGFIERVGDVFEVTVIGRPRERHFCGSFDAALGFLAATSETGNQ